MPPCSRAARCCESPTPWALCQRPSTMLLRKELPASTDRPAGKQSRQQAECPQQRPASLPWFQDNRRSRVPVYLPGQIVDPARKGEAGLGEQPHSQPDRKSVVTGKRVSVSVNLVSTRHIKKN